MSTEIKEKVAVILYMNKIVNEILDRIKFNILLSFIG